MKAAGTDTMKNEIKYEKSELELMTTYQLREICRREKIMNGVIHLSLIHILVGSVEEGEKGVWN